MKSRSLIFRSLAHYWRTHLGVVLGVALAALVLTGALMVGDSVKATLRAQAEARVGRVGEALLCGERFVGWPEDAKNRPAMVARIFAPGPEAAGVLLLQGTAERADAKARANRVQIVGVDEDFWKLSPSGHAVSFAETAAPMDAEVALNERLASQLGVASGDTLSLRLEKPGAFSKDAPLSGEEDAAVTLRVHVAAVVGDAEYGRFALISGQIPPATVFVPRAALQQKLGVGEKVNLVLNKFTHPPEGAGRSSIDRMLESIGLKTPKKFASTTVLDNLLPIDATPGQFPKDLQNYDLAIRELPAPGGFELKTSRVFLDPAVTSSARGNEKGLMSAPGSIVTSPLSPGLDSLTYFVTELRAGDGSDPKSASTPYSMVTAIDAPSSGFVQAELAENEIQITRWLADDLGIGPGGKVTVKYFVMGERRQLVEKSRTFSVLGPIIEMNEPQLNTSWMPDFPNVPAKEGLKSWKPGFPFEANRVRKKDEDYWAEHRGTPKAFLNLRVGQEMWGNRWGNLTSIRYPAGTQKEQVERIAAFIDPKALGIRVVPLREQALAATNAPVDFGELFAYFSFFLIVAAAVLTGLLFTFSIEQRAAEAGLLLAVGWRVKSVRRLFLREGLILALIGSLLGVAGAAIYTKLVLHALAGVWSGATGGTQFIFALSPITLGIGVASGVLVAALAMWLASRRLFKREAAQLLAGNVTDDPTEIAKDRKTASSKVGMARRAVPVPQAGREKATGEEEVVSAPGSEQAVAGAARQPYPQSRVSRGIYLAGILAVAAVALAALARGNPGAFFGAGALLLTAGLLFCRSTLRSVAQGRGVETLNELGARNTSRRSGRSLATIGVLASGVFMVVAVDSFRKGPIDDATDRQSGTGGFALIGESSAPIYEDLNSAKGREQYALDDDLLKDVRIVQMRVRDGDDASCLNLNRAVQPRLLGVSPIEWAGLSPFRFSGGPIFKGSPWMRLERHNDGGIDPVPAVVDANTLQWAIQKKIDDTFDYTDERGQSFQVKFAGALEGSMLQGLILISEQQFVEKFPNAAGYRFFLVDCPPAKAQAVREHLSKQLGDRGLELVPAAQRLAEFNAVENTYLSIFQVLGGLGMLLGSAGLGIVVARNVLERRREFGLLEAVGFTPRQLRRLVFAEHRWLIVGALAIGAISAIVAVWPQLSQKGGGFPWGPLGVLFGGVALIGAFCAWAATRVALRGSQLGALRSE